MTKRLRRTCKEDALYCKMFYHLGAIIFISISKFTIPANAQQAGRTFRLQPFSFPTDAIEGNKVSTMCATVTGGISSGVEFTWFKDGRKLVQDDRIRVRSYPDMSTLVVDPLTQKDSGNYTCVGKLRNQKDSHTEMLHVLVPVKWIHEPADVSLKETGNSTVICEATGVPRPTIKWTKEGMALSAQSPRLVFLKATKSDAGNYRCTADNGLQNPLTKQIQVTVFEFRLQPFHFPTDAVEGKTVTVTCTTTTAVSGVEYRWLKNNKRVSESAKMRLRTFPELSSLIVGPLEASDSGNYTCQATYNGKKNSFSDTLNVLVLPSWIQEPEDIKLMEGSNLTLPCRAKGKPQPNVVITKEGKDAAALSDTLDISKSTKHRSGTYVCKADNGLGHPLLKRFRVIVYGVLRLQPFYFPSKVVEGTTVTVTCTTTSGITNVHFRWLKDGREVVDKAKVKIIQHSLLSTLVIGQVDRGDSGNYTCVGNIGEKLDSHSEVLSVLAPPEWVVEPEDIKLHQGGNGTVTCEATGNPTPTVKWRLASQNGAAKETSASGRNLLQLMNASKLDAGTYECSAVNGVPEDIYKRVVVSIYGNALVVKVQPFYFPNDLLEGSRVSVTCSLRKVSSDARFKWLKDGKALDGNRYRRLSVRTEADFSMVTIEPTRQEDSGNYTCMVTSKGRSDSYTAALVVYAQPPLVQGKSAGTLQLTKTSKHDAGNYSCTATNGFGTAIEKTFLVKVYGKKHAFDDAISQSKSSH
ncbi:hemicentin-1 [Ixodes scapularis]|uniref:hemicentin-1 n=1 Tax=Ixodes scapularis TaxID=6945 RepID=UPI001A9F4A20|nr:hemicentin-1 [Ixodes scapularis]